jgi:hypothetical protein
MSSISVCSFGDSNILGQRASSQFTEGEQKEQTLEQPLEARPLRRFP